MEATIRFDVTGTCEQTVEVTKPGLTLEELEAGLVLGKFVTTVREGGTIVDVSDDLKVIGRIIESEVDGEYLDFEVDDA
jgi:hypothetical protein